MKIEIKKELDQETLKKVKEGLKRSRQLKPQTLRYAETYAKEWIFIKNNDNKVIGFAAIKKPEKDGFDSEIGFIYTYPDKELSKEDIIYKLISYINKKNGNGGIYASVLLNPIKKIFKQLGYDKIDEWDSEVRPGNKVELFTNKKLKIVSEDKMKKITLWDYLENKLNIFNESVYTITPEKMYLGGTTAGTAPGAGKELIKFSRQIKSIDPADSDIKMQLKEGILASGFIKDEKKVEEMINNFLVVGHTYSLPMEIQLRGGKIVIVNEKQKSLDKTVAKQDKSEFNKNFKKVV